jgi:hypothetical protein
MDRKLIFQGITAAPYKTKVLPHATFGGPCSVRAQISPRKTPNKSQTPPRQKIARSPPKKNDFTVHDLPPLFRHQPTRDRDSFNSPLATMCNTLAARVW